jgi:hypothetical protein
MSSYTMKNRRFRVNQLLKSPTRRLRRQQAKRYLTKPSHIRFSNNINNNWSTNFSTYSNNNIKHMINLVQSRQSIVPSKPRYRNVGLTPNQAKLFANMSANYNTPEEMLNAINTMNISNTNRETLRQKIYALYV